MANSWVRWSVSAVFETGAVGSRCIARSEGPRGARRRLHPACPVFCAHGAGRGQRLRSTVFLAAAESVVSGHHLVRAGHMLSIAEKKAAFVTRPPKDVGAWASFFDPLALPVLAATASEIEAFRTVEDEVDAHLLADAFGADPLLVLKVLSHLARLRRGREGGEPETLTAALVMLGIPPFFRAFTTPTTVEEWLSGRPEALAGFRRVMARSHRAAKFATAFAVHRMDHDAAIIHEAALLHDFAELLLWLVAPDLALEIARRQVSDPTLRSGVAQRSVLNIELCDLQHHLMVTWRLPSLLVQITDDHAQRETAQVANVRLAIRVARHSAQGWGNVALPDDFVDIGALLQLDPLHVERLLRDIDSA